MQAIKVKHFFRELGGLELSEQATQIVEDSREKIARMADDFYLAKVAPHITSAPAETLSGIEDLRGRLKSTIDRMPQEVADIFYKIIVILKNSPEARLKLKKAMEDTGYFSEKNTGHTMIVEFFKRLIPLIKGGLYIVA